MLRLEIKINIWKIKQIELRYNNILNSLYSEFPTGVVNIWKEYAGIKYNLTFNIIKASNIRKLEVLVRNSTGMTVEVDQERFVYNFTDVVLPEEVMKTLRLEPKFGIQIERRATAIPTIIEDIEFCIQNANVQGESMKIVEDNRNKIRSEVVNILTNFLKNNDPNEYDEVRKNMKITSKFLKEHDEVIVSRSDKGGSAVVMFKEEYITGMDDMLKDETTYRRITKDPTNKFQLQSNLIVKELLTGKEIDELNAKYLKTYNAIAPKIYGLRKTHKQVFALRPVVSCIGAPSYKLARFLHDILTAWTSTIQWNVKNSMELVNQIKTITVPDKHVLISLDVISLFTNIPKDLVLKIINEDWNEMAKVIKVKKDTLITLVKFCFESSYFTFQNRLYQQIDGSSMGNPASPSLANVVMNFVIRKAIDNLGFHIPLLKLYVDDTILLVPKDKIDDVFCGFNNINEKIKFTMEVEVEGRLPFLDLVVIREENRLITDWHMKKTNSGRLLNFKSNHPSCQKLGMIWGLLHRAINLSNERFADKNLLRVKGILKNNNYPGCFINKAIELFFKKLEANNNAAVVPNIKKCYKFPFIKGLSCRLNNCLNDTDAKLVFYNLETVKRVYTKLKDKTKVENKSNVVYKIPCSCNKVYIGQTSQYIKKRIAQHKLDCRAVNVLKENKTALAAHHFDLGHNFYFENVKLLDSERVHLKKNISEMIQITLHDTVNYRTDTQNLNTAYNQILDLYKKVMPM